MRGFICLPPLIRQKGLTALFPVATKSFHHNPIHDVVEIKFSHSKGVAIRRMVHYLAVRLAACPHGVANLHAGTRIPARGQVLTRECRPPCYRNVLKFNGRGWTGVPKKSSMSRSCCVSCRVISEMAMPVNRSGINCLMLFPSLAGLSGRFMWIVRKSLESSDHEAVAGCSTRSSWNSVLFWSSGQRSRIVLSRQGMKIWKKSPHSWSRWMTSSTCSKR